MNSLRARIKYLLCFLFLFAFRVTAFSAEPGAPVRDADDARRPVPSDQRPSSVLVYNYYTSNPTDAGKSDTEFSLTNISTSRSSYVHLFFVADGGATADMFVCLTSNQTVSFLASEIDPGVAGYAVFFATDSVGCPVSFNFLIGSERVKTESGHAAALSAEGYAALFNGPLPGCVATATSAVLALDGVRYTAAPQVLGLDKIPSPTDGNSTLLILNGLEGNLAIAISAIKSVSGTLFDDAESAFSFSASLTRTGPQFKTLLSDDFPQTTPKLTQVIRSGRTGWMRMMGDDGRAMSGAVITLNANATTRKGAFNDGHNLHHLRSGSGSFTVPVFAPNC